VSHPASGELLLPGEARGVKLQTCAVTGRQALRSQMIQSALTGEWMLKEVAVQSPETGRWCEPDRARRCAWTGQEFPADELGTCRVTGLPVLTSCLGPDGVLVPLQELAVQAVPTSADGELLAASRPTPSPWARRPCAHARPSALAEAGATAVMSRSRVLGPSLRRLGFVLAERPVRAVVGRVGAA
jgi:hypothetical protein